MQNNITGYKVGDLLLCLENYSTEFTKNKIYECLKYDAKRKVVRMIDDENEENGWDESKFINLGNSKAGRILYAK